MQLILASNSPRRRQILSEITENFQILPAQGEETTDYSMPPEMIVETLARAKAEEVFRANPNCAVLGADTIVYFRGNVLGKPKSEEDAFTTLGALSGNSHDVFTGVCIVTPYDKQCFYCRTRVTFNTLSDSFIRDYVKTGSPMDKAGSYGIQDHPALVRSYSGSFTNIVGLPKDEVRDKLVSMGIIK